MHDLYSEKDLQQISDQLKRRYLLMGCALAVVLAGFIVGEHSFRSVRVPSAR